jgi:uncharacterized membrane protein YfcA
VSLKQAYFPALCSSSPFTIYGKAIRIFFVGVSRIFSCRRERHWRVAIFFGGATLAGAFGGMAFRSAIPVWQTQLCLGALAYVIGKMDGVGGKRGWQW